MSLDIHVYMNMTQEHVSPEERNHKKTLEGRCILDFSDPTSLMGTFESSLPMDSHYVADGVKTERMGSYATFDQWRQQLQSLVDHVKNLVSNLSTMSKTEATYTSLYAIQQYTQRLSNPPHSLMYELLNCSNHNAVLATHVCATLAEEMSLIGDFLEQLDNNALLDLQWFEDDVFIRKFSIFHEACEQAGHARGCVVFN